jgi:peptide/nickel transport system permease protein
VTTYIARRIGLMIPVLFLVSVLVFVLIRAIPGDAVTLMAQDAGSQNAEVLRAKLGLDKPVPVQYALWLGNALHGDLGASFTSNDSVMTQILRAVPVTAELALLSMIIAVLIGVPLGIVSSVAQNTPLDYSLRVVSITGLSIPAFWLGTLFIMLPAIWFRYLPPTNYTPFFENPYENLRQMILPALALGYNLSAVTMRLTRSQALEVLRHDYIRTARAKGLRELAVVRRHVIRNALLPVVTVLGAQAGFLLGGTVILEQIFLLPGLGRVTLFSISVRDYPQIQGNVMIIVLMVVVLNLLIDLSYAWLDPRIRY